ncbi:MAG: class II glutamine amidotransferase, partial [Rhodoferax sp.]|nr:class II glutamine amidotransferase [Rhodoferax sp.]
YLVRQHPFTEVHLRDDDIKMDLSEHNGPEDRLAIVVTEPLTTNEAWTALEPGQFITFVQGCPQPSATVPRVVGGC